METIGIFAIIVFVIWAIDSNRKRYEAEAKRNFVRRNSKDEVSQ